MVLGDRQGGRRGVDARDRTSQGGHGLGEDPAAAADVEHPLPGERRARVDVADPQAVDVVQGLERPPAVPPDRRQRLELGQFLRIDV